MIPTPGRRPAAVTGIALATLALAVGCATPAGPTGGPSAGGSSAVGPTPTPAAATPPVAGLTWTKADVARPEDAFAEPSALPSGPSGPGTAGHPGHFPGQAIVDDVVAADGGLTAVGYVGIDGVWTAIAWRSSANPGRWALATLDATPGSFAVSVTTDPRTGLANAAGRSGRAPVVWTADGAGGWDRNELPVLSGGAEPERVVTLVATPDGLLAGGSAGPELGDRRARFWRLRDGLWAAVPDDPGFAGAEVVAIEPVDRNGYAAVGHLGTGQRGTGSVAWRSQDGGVWQRIDDPALAGGLVNGLATDRDRALVAVGSDLDEREAVVWRSTDGGATWARAPREASRLYEPYKIRMTDVVATPAGLVAVGNRVGLQYGTAASWLATDDWRTWRRSGNDPVLGQGEMLAVGPGGPGLVAVGSFGAPDNYVPTIWLSDEPGG